ncbi:MAG: lysophospholipase L1-like esterase [Myxococcota bacterium]|jgi:lysophospholipase L1-like esterase
MSLEFDAHPTYAALMERAKRWAPKLGLALVAVAVTVSILEVVFRFAMPASTHHLLYQRSADPVLRVELVAGADFDFEGVAVPIAPTRVTISEQGLRDDVYPPQKPRGVRRVLCVGDSTTFGWGVEQAETFCTRLSGHLPAGWETINLGVPGYNSTQEVRRLERFGLQFQPDVVMILFDGNDYESPIVYGGSDSWVSWLKDHSALARWVSVRIKGLGLDEDDSGPGPDHKPGAPEGQGGPHRAEDSGGEDWDGRAEVLKAFARLVTVRNENRFSLVVLMPNNDGEPELRALLSAASVPMVSIRPALWGPPEQLMIPMDGHPSAEGHRRIAALIAKALVNLGLTVSGIGPTP